MRKLILFGLAALAYISGCISEPTYEQRYFAARQIILNHQRGNPNHGCSIPALNCLYIKGDHRSAAELAEAYVDQLRHRGRLEKAMENLEQIRSDLESKADE